MKLVPKGILPSLGSTENEQDPLVRIKLFTPDANWTWYLIEYDILADMAFGYVVGLEKELGYFSIQELSGIRGPLGLKVERDLYWKPKRLSEVRKEHCEVHGS